MKWGCGDAEPPYRGSFRGYPYAGFARSDRSTFFRTPFFVFLVVVTMHRLKSDAETVDRKPDCWIPLEQLTRILGVSDTWLYKLRKTAGFRFERPSEADKRQIKVNAPKWLGNWAKHAAQSLHPRGNRPPDSALARKREAEADIAEIKRDRLRGQLMHVDNVKYIVETICAGIRAKLQLVRRISPESLELVVEGLDDAQRVLQSQLANGSEETRPGVVASGRRPQR